MQWGRFRQPYGWSNPSRDVLRCPFCQAPETERVRIEGANFVIFRCMFTPQVDPAQSDEEIEASFARQHSGGGAPYFRQMCDSLHLYVTKGAGARS